MHHVFFVAQQYASRIAPMLFTQQQLHSSASLSYKYLNPKRYRSHQLDLLLDLVPLSQIPSYPVLPSTLFKDPHKDVFW
jgi:hypothetical protein